MEELIKNYNNNGYISNNNSNNNSHNNTIDKRKPSYENKKPEIKINLHYKDNKDTHVDKDFNGHHNDNNNQNKEHHKEHLDNHSINNFLIEHKIKPNTNVTKQSVESHLKNYGKIISRSSKVSHKQSMNNSKANSKTNSPSRPESKLIQDRDLKEISQDNVNRNIINYNESIMKNTNRDKISLNIFTDNILKKKTNNNIEDKKYTNKLVLNSQFKYITKKNNSAKISPRNINSAHFKMYEKLQNNLYHCKNNTNNSSKINTFAKNLYKDKTGNNKPGSKSLPMTKLHSIKNSQKNSFKNSLINSIDTDDNNKHIENEKVVHAHPNKFYINPKLNIQLKKPLISSTNPVTNQTTPRKHSHNFNNINNYLELNVSKPIKVTKVSNVSKVSSKMSKVSELVKNSLYEEDIKLRRGKIIFN